MAKRERIARYAANEVRTKVTMAESRTDWQRVDTTTAADIERQAQEDEVSDEWSADAAVTSIPPQKTPANIKLDQDIIDFFEDFGPGHQARINSVLRSFVEQ